MQARCQIRTRSEQSLTPAPLQGLRFIPSILRCLTDSKTLSSDLTPYFQPQHALVRTSPVNGLERAFTSVPANLKVFHPKAARRDL
jgi:hypothetical protein